MAYPRLSKEKQALVIAALCEGTPIRAVARMFKVRKDTIHRVICETGEAFADYMDKELRDLPHAAESKWMSNGSMWARTGAGFRRTTRPSAGIIGCGLALMRTRNWCSRM